MKLELYEKLKNSFRGVINKSIENTKTIETKLKDKIVDELKFEIPKTYSDNIVSTLDESIYSICVFDLDNTLIETDLFEHERKASKNNTLDINDFLHKLDTSNYRVFFTRELLEKVRNIYPNIKFAVFTRSTATYANTILSHIYNSFHWDLIITNESVRVTKPNTEGLLLIMKNFKETDPRRMLIIGDSDVDVKLAYYNNSTSLFTDWFGNRRKTEHWKAINLLPDGIINSPDMLLDILKFGVTPLSLESQLSERQDKSNRFGVVSHFFPIGSNVAYERKPFNISVSGRYFTSAFSAKKAYHLLTKSILANKESRQFPVEWIHSLVDFIREQILDDIETVVTVIPHRPNREPRLEFMLEQLRNFVKNNEFRNVIFCQDLLKFKEGVLSQHNDKLNQEQRFKNIGNHLQIHRPDLVKNRNIIVIDDIVTTGASLMYASIYLKNNGANNVSLFALAQTISK